MKAEDTLKKELHTLNLANSKNSDQSSNGQWETLQDEYVNISAFMLWNMLITWPSVAYH